MLRVLGFGGLPRKHWALICYRNNPNTFTPTVWFFTEFTAHIKKCSSECNPHIATTHTHLCPLILKLNCLVLFSPSNLKPPNSPAAVCQTMVHHPNWVMGPLLEGLIKMHTKWHIGFYYNLCEG